MNPVDTSVSAKSTVARARSPRSRRHVLAWGALTLLSACGGNSEVAAATTALSTSTHLFDLPASSVEVGGALVSETLAHELEGDVVWIRGELPTRGDWQVDRERFTSSGPLRVWAPTRFPVLGPARLVSWPHADEASGGRLLRDGETVEPRVGEEVLILARGLEATVAEVGQFPPARGTGYPTDPALVAASQVGVLPTLERVAEPRRTELRSLSRRTAAAPAPTRISWNLDVPAGAHLCFGYALRRSRLEAFPGGGVRVPRRPPVDADDPGSVVFRLSARPEGSAEEYELWTGELAAGDVGKFLDARVPLGFWSGQTVELSFSTELGEVAPRGGLVPLWSEPYFDAPRAGGPPNIILVVCDTLRADVLGCYGNPRDVSPHIDALAARGIRFADPMCAATWTLPSHTSIMSSLYPTQHGVQYRERMHPDVDSLAEVLRAGGYTTFAVTEGIFVTPKFGLDQGFDDFRVCSWEAESTFDRALARIRKLRGPYFLYLHTFQAHAPWVSVPRWRERFVDPYDGPLTVPIANQDWAEVEGGLDEDDERFIRQMYDAEVAYIDEQIGRLVEAVEQQGQLENTLFVFTSDHGEAFDEHGSWGHGSSVYREQLQVPLILAQPGRFEGGQVANHPVHSIDIAPTAARAAGLAIPESWMGHPLSLEPGETDRELFGAFLVPPWQLRASVLRRGSVKIMQYPAGSKHREGARIGPAEVLAYDLERDPGELHDIWPSVREQLGWDDLSPLWEQYPPLFETDRSRIDSDLQDQLESLGYAGNESD